MRLLKFLTVATATLLCGIVSCNKASNPSPKQPTYKSFAGNWKYETDSIRVYFTVVDSLVTNAYGYMVKQWVRSGVITYRTLTQYQRPADIQAVSLPVDGSSGNFSVVCANLNAVVDMPSSIDNYATMQSKQLVLYHSPYPNPILVPNAKFVRK